MEQKINIAELLKDAPQGTKLYSKLHGEVVLRRVLTGTYTVGYIHVSSHGHGIFFDGYGRPEDYPNAECMLLPAKGQSWEDFKPSWKPDHKHFKPFEMVIVANYDKATDMEIWTAALYSHYDGNFHRTTSGLGYTDRGILDYKDNEDKIGKEAEK